MGQYCYSCTFVGVYDTARMAEFKAIFYLNIVNVISCIRSDFTTAPMLGRVKYQKK